ncbi:hypothetical protein [Acinetobacter pragensis]|uniref:Uncharacterized protein n=1 Tax=Acinetobacter pragensis TaxID=1806892 RepID=A0A151Y235_9GAMM|nr:hypothetical protein [Acinetobacter pragensis]KYQ72060.1 hypothetical protein AZH43_12665 [Acinetobacter pragensis]
MNKPKFQYWFFIIFTVVYFLILNRYFGITVDKIKALEANALGDFLAGTFSPLAFLFLILGYLQNNKNLSQNTEAISQQAIALKQQAVSLQQQAKSLETQIAELKISNEAYQRQVDEMEKSVEAQQNMFLLAEKQYLESIDEKTQSSIPQLRLTGSKYNLITHYNNDYEHRFDLTLKVHNLSIKNLKLKSNSWNITKSGGAYDNSSDYEIHSIDPNSSITLMFYVKTNIVPFTNSYLDLDYYDEKNNKYIKRYQIIKTSDEVVLLKECI